jgi:hypothetical protein
MWKPVTACHAQKPKTITVIQHRNIRNPGPLNPFLHQRLTEADTAEIKLAMPNP